MSSHFTAIMGRKRSFQTMAIALVPIAQKSKSYLLEISSGRYFASISGSLLIIGKSKSHMMYHLLTAVPAIPVTFIK